jgi:hypothetical protein
MGANRWSRLPAVYHTRIKARWRSATTQRHLNPNHWMSRTQWLKLLRDYIKPKSAQAWAWPSTSLPFSVGSRPRRPSSRPKASAFRSSPRDLRARAEACFAAHREELVAEAREIVGRWRAEGFGKRASLRNNDQPKAR